MINYLTFLFIIIWSSYLFSKYFTSRKLVNTFTNFVSVYKIIKPTSETLYEIT